MAPYIYGASKHRKCHLAWRGEKDDEEDQYDILALCCFFSHDGAQLTLPNMQRDWKQDALQA